MRSELQVLLTVSCVVMTASAGVFLLVNLRRGWSVASRLWVLAALAAALTQLAYIVSGATGDVWWSVAIGNAGMVLAIGLTWLGCRAFNGRGLPVAAAMVAVVALAVGIAASLPDPDGSKWAGAELKFAGLVVLSLAAAIECLRPRLRSMWPAWLVVATMLVHAGYLVVRLAVVLAVGPEGPGIPFVFSTGFVSLMNAVLVVIVTAAVILLQIGESRGAALTAAGLPDDRSILPSWTFRARAAQERSGAVVVFLIEEFATIRAAFGGMRAGETTSELAVAVVEACPAALCVGHFGRGRILALLPIEDERELARTVRRTRENIRVRLAGFPIEPPPRLRAAWATIGAGGRRAVTIALRAAASAPASSDEATGAGRV